VGIAHLWLCQFISAYTPWSKSHAIYFKIFIDSWNPVQLDWISKYTVLLWPYKIPRRSRHVVTCSRQSASCFRTVKCKDVFFQVQWVFIVEHCLACRSYLACQSESWGPSPDSPVPNKSTVSRLGNRFRDTGTLHRVASGMSIAERGGHFQHLKYLFLFCDFSIIYFLTYGTCVRNWSSDFSIILYSFSRIVICIIIPTLNIISLWYSVVKFVSKISKISLSGKAVAVVVSLYVDPRSYLPYHKLVSHPSALKGVLQTLVVAQLVQKFRIIYGTRKFIAAFTRVRS
jgi:hypothetical protein